MPHTFLALVVALLAVYAGAGAPAAQAAPKAVVSFVGNPTTSTGTTGSLFNTPRGVAVNQVTGNLYVVDSSNNRIQRFDSSGAFVSAWGRDVVSGGDTGFEICTVAADCKAAASSTGLGGELNAPQGIALDQATGDVYVTEQSGLRVQKFDEDGNFLLAFGRDVLVGGATTTEVCTVAASCKAGVSGGAGGEFASTFSGHPAVDPTSGDLYVADPGNRRVQEFTSAGAFVRTFGYDVETGGTTGFEVCTVAASCKIAATGGSNTGQFASGQPTRVAVDPAGSVYTVESATNFRVQKFLPFGVSPPLTPTMFAAGVLTGTAGTSAPNEVAVDPASGHVFVAKGLPILVGSTLNSVRQVLELDSVGSLVETHGAASGLSAVNGLAVRSTGRIYMSSSASGHRVFLIDTPVAPSVALDPTPVDGIGTTSATFHGHVDPTGFTTAYRFEYRRVGDADWTSLPTTDADAGPVDSSNPVSQTASELEPNTSYEIRLVATKAFGGGSATTAPPAVFTTLPAPPRVVTLAAGDRTDTHAWLGGQIDAQHAPTNYWIEYSTDPSFPPLDTASFPASEDADAGSGSDYVAVSQLVSGLSADTTYHFRLVATNPTGTIAGAAKSFHTDQALPVPPPGRAYEKVSPNDKNGFDVIPWGRHSATDDGSKVAFSSTSSAPGSAGGWITPLIGTRDPDAGWSARPADIPMPAGAGAYVPFSFSPDLSQQLIQGQAALAPTATEGPAHLYLRDLAPDPADDHFRQINPNERQLMPGFPITSFSSDYVPSGVSSDWTQFVYQSAIAQTADVVAGQINLYKTRIDGSTRLIGLVPQAGETLCGDAGSACVIPNKGSIAGSSGFGSLAGAVSRDGNRVVFHVVASTTASASSSTAGQLYVRDDHGTAMTADDTTLHVSASQKTNGSGLGGTDPAGPLPAFFWAAERQRASKILFTSCEQLTNDSTAGDGDPTCARGDLPTTTPASHFAGHGRDLYLYDADTGGLTDLTAADPSGADVFGVVDTSDDLTSVYFVAGGDLAAGAEPGQPNLYLWTAATGLRFIATLSSEMSTVSSTQRPDYVNWGPRKKREGGGASYVTPDGGHFIFTSNARLTTYDNTSPSCAFGRCTEIYLYDAHANQLSCISCPVDGAPATGNAYPADTGIRAAGDLPDPLPINLTPDGARAYFETPQRLTEADRDSNVDVYEYTDGTVHLISAGTGSSNSHFADATPSGSDVFFTTRDRLVSSDVDASDDLYNARIGGGFPATGNTTTPCQGDACQGPTVALPRLSGAGSITFHGAGDISGPADRPGLASLKVSKLKTVIGSATRLKVKVSGAGSIRISGAAVDTAKRILKKAGIANITVRLTAKERKALKKRVLRARVKVAFKPKIGRTVSKTVVLTFRQPTRKGR